MPTVPKSVERFTADRSGTILIPGLCMGIILVLCCMHVIGVTEAILVRAIGQNAADAVALESAVWHAQGMNLLVMLNLIMAAVMSLLLAIRIVEIILIGAIAILTIAAAVASFFSFGTAGSAAAEAIVWLSRALLQVQRFEDRVSEPIMRTLTFAADAERLVAASVPYIAYGRPITRSADIPGVALSVSLIPAVLEQKFSKAPQIPILSDAGSGGGKPNVGGFEWETSFPARMGTLPLGSKLNDLIKKQDKKIAAKTGKAGLVQEPVDLVKGLVGSLPAQEEDFYQLCERAGELLSALFLRVLAGPLGLGDGEIEKISSFIGVIVGSMQTLTCTPIKSIGDSILSEIEAAADKSCTDQEAAWEAEDGNDGKKWDDKKRKKCREDEKKKSGYKKPTDAESIKVARLWGLILQPKSSPFLHVWATVPIESRFDIDPANAEAEFRHVCDGGTDAASRGCSENSLWRPGWFAKMVPVRDITDELAAKFGDMLAGWFSRAVGKAITGIVDKLVAKFIPKGNVRVNDVIARQIGTAIGPKVANGWWNRRFLTGQITSLLGIQRISLLHLERYPEYLH